jgi:hypothetical protein
MLSDQNFVPVLPSETSDCIAICRAENATLRELAEFCFELLPPLPENAILCYGSASHLYRCGASL